MNISDSAKRAAEQLYNSGYLYLGIKGREKPIEGVYQIIQSAIDLQLGHSMKLTISPTDEQIKNFAANIGKIEIARD